jgi:hypothetical protein
MGALQNEFFATRPYCRFLVPPAGEKPSPLGEGARRADEGAEGFYTALFKIATQFPSSVSLARATFPQNGGRFFRPRRSG